MRHSQKQAKWASAKRKGREKNSGLVEYNSCKRGYCDLWQYFIHSFHFADCRQKPYPSSLSNYPCSDSGDIQNSAKDDLFTSLSEFHCMHHRDWIAQIVAARHWFTTLESLWPKSNRRTVPFLCYAEVRNILTQCIWDFEWLARPICRKFTFLILLERLRSSCWKTSADWVVQ